MRLSEAATLLLGVALLFAFFALSAQGEAESLRDLNRFQAAKAATDAAPQPDIVRPRLAHPSQARAAPTAPATGRAPGRASGTAAPDASEVLAVLRIVRIGLEVPVKYGTGADTLRSGAGLIEGTSLPGSTGNVAIAAHRDTFFRGLEALVTGDLIQLDTPERNRHYRVASLTVVDPDDVQVLDNTGADQLTLVTCYPFHYFGNAPQRFIVRAEEDLVRPDKRETN